MTATWPKPWLALCACGYEARSATSAGALVLSEAHRARSKFCKPAVSFVPETEEDQP